MYITTVNYQKTFNLGNYSSEKIGVEISINPGEDAKEALVIAKNLVEEYHKENNPEGEMKGTTERIVEKPMQGVQDFAMEINACKELEGNDGLLSWRTVANNNPELKDIFETKLKELQP